MGDLKAVYASRAPSESSMTRMGRWQGMRSCCLSPCPFSLHADQLCVFLGQGSDCCSVGPFPSSDSEGLQAKPSEAEEGKYQRGMQADYFPSCPNIRAHMA